jgi:hypothetical protein
MSVKPKGAETTEIKKEEIVAAIPGNGTFVFPDGSKYVGDYVDTGGVKVREGDGTWTFGPESYVGAWKSDQMHGRGKYKFASGSKYDGNFVNGAFEGIGTYTFSDGAVYKGSWKQNSMHGTGEYIDASKVKWTGEFFNGMFDTGKTYISLRPTLGL